MDSGMIGKIQKAKRYAEERDRIHVDALQVHISGTNNNHTVKFNDGKWACTCGFFQTRERCSHTMALEIILEGMLPEPVY